MMTRYLVLALLAVSLALGGTAARAALHPRQSDCAEKPIAEAEIAGAPRLVLEIATTPDQRSRGLMFRESLPENQGMLFVYDQQSDGPFWMLNTLIALSIAYIDRDGTILDIQDMHPLPPDQQPNTYPPSRPYWYALEVNQGWYARNGVGVGDRFTFCGV